MTPYTIPTMLLGATPTPTPGGFQNASASLNGFGSAYGLAGPLLLVVYVMAALLAAQFVAPWIARSELLSNVAGGVLESVAYAIKGAAASGVLLLAALPVYLLAQADGDTQGVAVQVIAAGAGLYVVLVVVGWLADRAVSAFIDAHPDYEEWADIGPDVDDDLEEAAD